MLPARYQNPAIVVAMDGVLIRPMKGASRRVCNPLEEMASVAYPSAKTVAPEVMLVFSMSYAVVVSPKAFRVTLRAVRYPSANGTGWTNS
jgi:hypothetical protein